MTKITPKLIDEIFDESVLSVLPANDDLKRGVGNAKQAEKIRGRKNPEHSERMTNIMLVRHQDQPLTAKQKKKIADSNKKYHKENPRSEEQKYACGNNMRGKTLEEIIGPERAAAGRKTRSDTNRGKKRPKEVGKKIAATRKANGSYENSGMTDHVHKESTKTIMAAKAAVRQEIKRKLGLGRADKVPRDLLEQEYKKRGL